MSQRRRTKRNALPVRVAETTEIDLEMTIGYLARTCCCDACERLRRAIAAGKTA